MMKFLFITAVLLLFFSTKTLLAQNVIANSGGHFKSPQLQIGWTLGEPVIETLESGNFCLTQGFHQSILTVTAIDLIQNLLVEINAYPNPVTTKINLSINYDSSKNWTYSLYNNEGKLLVNKKIDSEITQIPMQMYAASNYILQVNDNHQKVKSFKIVKSK